MLVKDSSIPDDRGAKLAEAIRNRAMAGDFACLLVWLSLLSGWRPRS